MPELVFEGLTPEPLISYLSALGLLRVVAEQRDPDVRLRFTDDGVVLSSTLDIDALLDFFVDDYAPAPIVSPWNGGSGFFAGDKGARDVHDRLLADDHHRFVPLTDAIRIARTIAPDHKPEGKKDEQLKRDVIQQCRNLLSDDAIQWIDAIGVIESDKVRFAPLLGTGGNDGRFDLSKNFVDNIADVLLDMPRDDARMRLSSLLLAQDPPQLRKRSAGQFDPGTLPESGDDALIEPWRFILAVEGMLLFASAATRRGVAAHAGASFPFLVRGSAGGYESSAPDEIAAGRDELWLPIWTSPLSKDDIDQVFREARIEWNGRRAETALEARTALASNGVAWGVEEFSRFSLLQRNGLAYIATPTGRISVRERPVIDGFRDLARYAEQLRKLRLNSDMPTSATQAAIAFEHAWFAACDTDDPEAVQSLLVATGQIELIRLRSSRVREHAYLPQLTLSRSWVHAARNDTAEWRIAAAVASMTGMRKHILGVIGDSSHAQPELVWTGRNALRDLGAILERRMLNTPSQDSTGPTTRDARSYFSSSEVARAADIAAWFDGNVDVERVAALLPAMVCIDWQPASTTSTGSIDPRYMQYVAPDLPPAYLLLRPFIQAVDPGLATHTGSFRFDPAPIRMLMAGRSRDACNAAARLHNARGLCHAPNSIIAPDISLLAASLLIPVADVTPALHQLDPDFAPDVAPSISPVHTTQRTPA